ncbi:hypothetical protein HNQ51_002046 [Inhella inkyongensis]|uniref:STAS/SEC14 domain-containing protein n=1 Tax=Inhella inkyongensis TaxID=392593 RepID=A0A840S589_9BURK|nr:hypothetical protein [Inhella inkyongensis]MBB5204732.1 hypothetical protein [Inhella inkyongensis]
MRAEINPFQSARFPAHGEVQIDWVGRMLCIRARGPFNAEFMLRATQALASIRTGRPADGLYLEWVHWMDSMLMPPEAWDRLALSVQRFVDADLHGRLNLVIAAPDVEARWLMLPRLQALWGQSRPVEVFDDLESAQRRAEAVLAAWPPLPA